MTFKELADLILKDNPEGIWVHFGNFPDGWGEVYLDEDYQKEFESVLDKEVADYYIDECGYDLLEVFLNDD